MSERSVSRRVDLDRGWPGRVGVSLRQPANPELADALSRRRRGGTDPLRRGGHGGRRGRGGGRGSRRSRRVTCSRPTPSADGAPSPTREFMLSSVRCYASYCYDHYATCPPRSPGPWPCPCCGGPLRAGTGGRTMSSVSVVIPCYKYGHFLEDVIGSVLDDQEGVDVRVLIIDDASTDDGAQVARKIAARDPRVGGNGHARNQGNIATFNEALLDCTDGHYCTLVSADDRLTPGAL